MFKLDNGQVASTYSPQISLGIYLLTSDLKQKSWFSTTNAVFKIFLLVLIYVKPTYIPKFSFLLHNRTPIYFLLTYFITVIYIKKY